MGESKTAAVLHDGIFGTLGRIAAAMCIGPFTTLKLFFARILTLFSEGDSHAWTVVAGAGFGLSIVLYFAKMRTSDS